MAKIIDLHGITVYFRLSLDYLTSFLVDFTRESKKKIKILNSKTLFCKKN